MNLKKEAIKLHEKLKGKIEIKPKIKIDQKNLSLLYTPGVAEVVSLISKNKKDIYKYTGKGNSVAIISDGSRVLGLGNKGGESALPVMEGKALIYKQYGNVDAIPICLKTQNKDEIIKIVENISLNFGAINIEDIEAPKCFYIVDKLTKKLDIPVFHDDQHGTAVVVLAALLNALKLVKKNLSKVKIVVLGAGAAGYGITNLLVYAGAKNILVLDSKGIISKKRNDLNKYKLRLARLTNSNNLSGDLNHAIKNADIFIGVSGQKNILTKGLISLMNKDKIIFALSNPDSEILPAEAKKFGVRIIATGRSDFKNQVNNSVVFPFIMRKILDKKIKKIDLGLMYTTALNVAKNIKNLSYDKIIPLISEIKIK